LSSLQPRAQRTNETHGKDYFFVSKEEFARMIDEDELIEHAMVYGDYKGIPKQQVREALASGKDVVMRIDVQGAETVRKLAPQALMIFITTENERIWCTAWRRARPRPSTHLLPHCHGAQGAQSRGGIRLCDREPRVSSR
jgi:guanylate kinase